MVTDVVRVAAVCVYPFTFRFAFPFGFVAVTFVVRSLDPCPLPALLRAFVAVRYVFALRFVRCPTLFCFAVVCRVAVARVGHADLRYHVYLHVRVSLYLVLPFAIAVLLRCSPLFIPLRYVVYGCYYALPLLRCCRCARTRCSLIVDVT